MLNSVDEDGDDMIGPVSFEEASKYVYGDSWWQFMPISPVSDDDFWDRFATSHNDVPFGMGDPRVFKILVCSDPDSGFVYPRLTHDVSGYSIMAAEDIVPLLKKLLHFYENSTAEDIERYDTRGWYRSVSARFLDQWYQFPSSNTAVEGWVYILKTEDGLYKIGKTTDLDKRVRTLKIQLPYKVELFHSVKTKHYHDFERFLHMSLGYFRMNGEWFKLPESIAEYLTYVTALI